MLLRAHREHRGMSKEARSIMFAQEETRAAFAAFLGRKLKGVDPYTVEKVELSQHGGAVSAEVSVLAGQQIEASALDSNEVMAAMLMHCRGRRIPLSNRATKKTELSEGRLVLV